GGGNLTHTLGAEQREPSFDTHAAQHGDHERGFVFAISESLGIGVGYGVRLETKDAKLQPDITRVLHHEVEYSTNASIGRCMVFRNLLRRRLEFCVQLELWRQ